LVLGAWCLVLGAWCLVLGAWCLVLGAWCLVLGAWCLVLGAFDRWSVEALVKTDGEWIGSLREEKPCPETEILMSLRRKSPQKPPNSGVNTL